MKHTRVITVTPQLAQEVPGSNFEAKMTFLVNLTDQAVRFAFEKTN